MFLQKYKKMLILFPIKKIKDYDFTLESIFSFDILDMLC